MLLFCTLVLLSLISSSGPFVSVPFTNYLQDCLTLSVSLSQCLSVSVHSASHRNPSQGTPGETNWIKQVQSSAGAWLSLTLFHHFFFHSCSRVLLRVFPLIPFRSPSLLLVVPANPFPFAALFILYPLLLQSPSLCFFFSLSFLSISLAR